MLCMIIDQRLVIVWKIDVYINILGFLDKVCLIYLLDYFLNQCREFLRWDMKKCKDLLKKKGICFKCCVLNNYLMKNCKYFIQCEKCDSELYLIVLYVIEFNIRRIIFNSLEMVNNYGGEGIEVFFKCIIFCGFVNGGCFCVKIVLVKVFFIDCL